jgi:hypothetical protein
MLRNSSRDSSFTGDSNRLRLLDTARHYHHGVMALLGVTIYRMLFPEVRTRRVCLGLQPERFARTRVDELPYPSERNTHYSYRVMLAAFRKLKRLV